VEWVVEQSILRKLKKQLGEVNNGIQEKN
jgi:hypothetical protein